MTSSEAEDREVIRETDTSTALRELDALLRSAAVAYADWNRIGPDGRDRDGSPRRYTSEEQDDRCRAYLTHIRQIEALIAEIRELAIAAAITDSGINNRQIASAVGMSHPTIARRRVSME